jgi:hypothetical protein
VRLIVGDAMTGVALGVMLGVPAALMAGRLVRPCLFGVAPSDALSLVGVAVVLVLMRSVASVLPARLAGSWNPAVVLRND